MRRLVLFCGTIVAIFFSLANGQLQSSKPISKQNAANILQSQPLYFTENRGQWKDNIEFMAEAGNVTVQFCQDEVIYCFVRNSGEVDCEATYFRNNPNGNTNEIDKIIYKKEAMLIRVRFVGANRNPVIIKGDRLSNYCNYFYGNQPDLWYSNVRNYSSVVYQDIYPGIDLKYYGNNKSLKYDFIIKPGADISQIRIRYEGVDDISISNAGDLKANTKIGPVYDISPRIYQNMDGKQKEISGRFTINESGVFGFEIGEYDQSVALVIDPELDFSTYLGGDDNDYCINMAIDHTGNIYIAGYTSSRNFPLVNPFDPYNNGIEDVFVTKFAASNHNIVFSTYMGGYSADGAYSLAVDDSGNIFLAGATVGGDFPVVNAFCDSFCGGYNDAFVAKLSSTGDTIVYSTYLGGDNQEVGWGIAVDSSGNAYITGDTHSNNFPITNAYDMSFNGGSDAFVTKLTNKGDSLVYSTFIGGNSWDEGYGIRVDGTGNSYITGQTGSYNFPLENPYDNELFGYEAFVTKLSPAGDSLDYSTFLGGNGEDRGKSIVIDSSLNAYVVGWTNSLNFPTTNPYSGNYGGGDFDVFVAKISSEGNALIYGTYLGGNGIEQGWAIDLDKSGSAYVTGTTESSNFPTENPYDSSYNGLGDAFVTKLSPGGNLLSYSSYFGGSNGDYGTAIGVDTGGNLYLAGYTYSTDFPIYNAIDSIMNGGADVYVSKFVNPGSGINGLVNIPTQCELSQNYPNPFNGQTTIKYFLNEQSEISIEIYDVLGRKIETIDWGIKSTGEHKAVWDASDMPSGIYFYRIKTENQAEVKRMILIK